ncbi:hypothetical protein GGX14DRAFT_297004, partial [Mycena pura]
TRLSEALAWCTANRSKPVGTLGDLNSRTQSDCPSSSQLTRVSSDTEPTNQRGAWLLRTCEEGTLDILNGTCFERGAPGGFTSFQPNGKAVVDYALFSRGFLNMLSVDSLQVVPVPSDWSDHAILALHVVIPPALSTA